MAMDGGRLLSCCLLVFCWSLANGMEPGPPAGRGNSSWTNPPLSDCLKRLVAANPEVRSHFSRSVADQMCRMNVEWQRLVDSHNATVGDGDGASVNVDDDQQLTLLGLNGTRSNFTNLQRSWLRSIYNCQDFSCVCRRTNSCRDDDDDLPNNSTDHRQPQRQRRRLKRQNLILDQSLQDRVGRAFRRELRELTDDERNRYFQALNSLKFDRIDGMSKFDILVLYHTPEYAPEAHFSAALLPYHREMLKNFEIALRMVDPGVSLPYWDSTLDSSLPNPTDSVLWTPLFFGNGFGEVFNGPFRNWFTAQDAEIGLLTRSGRIVRNIGSAGRLMTDWDINVIMSKPRFRNLVFCVDPFFETAHGATHMWIGGHSQTLRISPNDPVFHSWHAFIDLIWEQWRWSHQSYEQREREYVFNNEACNGVSAGNARMQPYPLTNAQGLSNRYTDRFYSYSDRPSCPSCGPYLFCDTRQNRCLSKVRQGGRCGGYEGFDICHNGVCQGGWCRQGSFSTDQAANTVVANPGSAGCRNDHACCAFWASSGECDRNADWMRTSCRSACGICSGGSNSGCSDSDSNCPLWASRGECQSNPTWMSVSCQASCNTCNVNVDAQLCGGGGGGGGNQGGNAQSSNSVACRNNDGRCEEWAGQGECQRNPDWMSVNCAAACNACR